MKSYWLKTFVLSIAVLFCASVAPAATVKIKLATLAPTGSSYHKSLLALRDQWKKASNNHVDLVIYPDGKLGGEADVVNLMTIGSVQGGLLTSVGLSVIEKGVAGLQSIPMGFDSLDEVDHINEKLSGLLEDRLQKKGFVTLFWMDAGWVRFFGKKPFTTPDDLKQMKLFCWAGNPEQVEIYKSAGFNPVPLETADILPGLQTGLIEAAPLPPVFALAGQVDTRAPYMLELNWGPLVGACVVRKETWERIPAEIRPELLKAAREAGKEIKASGRKESDESVAAMEKRGLTVTKVSPDVAKEWRATAEATYPKVRGGIVPADMFDKTMEVLKEYRQSQAK